MPPAYDPQYDIFHKVTNPAEQWVRDRGIIASWLLRQADAGLDGAEHRLDGTSNAVIASGALGNIAVHDYWSFCRPDFDLSNRQQSYHEILSRQVPILSFDYFKGNDQSTGQAQLVVFLNGEMDTTQGYAETFAPFTQQREAGELVAVESNVQTAGQAAVDIYNDPFYQQLLVAIRRGIMNSPQVS